MAPHSLPPSAGVFIDRTCWPIVVVQATLKASDTDAVKISKELWGKMNPSYDSSATRMMSAAQESVSSLRIPLGHSGTAAPGAAFAAASHSP